jgi:enoyl-CoA hydratase
VSELVLTEVADQIATITLNRPEARNALSGPLIKDLRAAVRAAQDDDSVSVIILTGADPAFCAGLDLKELGGGSSTLTSTAPKADTPVASRGPLPPGPKPVIGAINGAAITGGFELALACDFLVASDRARFADTHARVGIQPWWGLTVLLPQAIGLRRAREMSATGNFCDAQRALDWGLVNHVVPTTSCWRSPAASPPTSPRAISARCARSSPPTPRGPGSPSATPGWWSPMWPPPGRARASTPTRSSGAARA